MQQVGAALRAAQQAGAARWAAQQAGAACWAELLVAIKKGLYLKIGRGLLRIN